MLWLVGCIYGAYVANALYNIIYLRNTLNSTKKISWYMRCIYIKLSVVEVERGQKGSDHVELSDHAEFFRDHAEL